jgi:methyl-accepting chemotaxis protein
LVCDGPDHLICRDPGRNPCGGCQRFKADQPDEIDRCVSRATAAEEQSSAAEQISKNIEHISSVTRETATGAEQSAAAAEELNRQAEGLQQMVQRFRVNA